MFAKPLATVLAVLALTACTVVDPNQQQPTTPAQPQAQPASQPVVEGPTAQQIAVQGPTAQPVATQGPTATFVGQAQGPGQAGTIPDGSNYGTVELTSGFMPDPRIVAGTSGGTMDASAFGPDCKGWIAHRPDHLFVAQGPFGRLRILAHSQADVTLVVLTPDNRYLCNDDAEGRDPMIESSFTPGTYRIWIGSFEQNTNSPYQLGFSERQNVTPSTLASGGPGDAPVAVATGTDSNFGTVTLSTGFEPDPHAVAGVSGGRLNATTVGSHCTGSIAPRPDHILQAQTGFNDLHILVRSDADTTLVMQAANGQVWCDDDTEGRNPVIHGPFAPGTYRIWVGSYQQGTESPYTIGFSELPNASTMALPAPASSP